LPARTRRESLWSLIFPGKIRDRSSTSNAVPSWPEAAGQQCRPMKSLRGIHSRGELFAIPQRVMARLQAANPESIVRSSAFGFRVRELYSCPGMTVLRERADRCRSLMQLRRLQEPVAVAGLEARLDGLAVAIDRHGNLNSGRPQRPYPAIEAREI